MSHATPRSHWRRALAAAALAGASAVASAAPYAITYNGTISGSTIPEILNGQPYAVTLVFDNGGSTANSQTWTGANLTCTIWRMNTAGNVTFAQNLVTTPPSGVVAGSVTTSAAGALTTVFSSVTAVNVAAGAYTSTGVALTAPVYWFANSLNGVFYDSLGGPQARAFSDPLGGVQMNIASWSAPQPFSGGCNAAPAPAAVAPVPTLGEWSLALLGLAAAGFGARRLRRRG